MTQQSATTSAQPIYHEFMLNETGTVGLFDISPEALQKYGVAFGDTVLLPKTGKIATVVGIRDARLWGHSEGDLGAVALEAGSPADLEIVWQSGDAPVGLEDGYTLGTHKVKHTLFLGREIAVVLQNHNGPCPLLAIINVLLLRGDITLSKATHVLSVQELCNMLRKYLVEHPPPEGQEQEKQEPVQQPPAPEEGQPPTPALFAAEPSGKLLRLRYDDYIAASEKLISRLQYGLDVNPIFAAVDSFGFSLESSIFPLLSIGLYHAWLPDPQLPGAAIISPRHYEYLSARLVVLQESLSSGIPPAESPDQSPSSPKSGEKRVRAEIDPQEESEIIQAFLNAPGQCTPHGIVSLFSLFPAATPAVMFRNNHFLTIYRTAAGGPILCLVTDIGYATEEHVVWETLEAFGSPTFYTHDFRVSCTAMQDELITKVATHNPQYTRAEIQEAYDRICASDPEARYTITAGRLLEGLKSHQTAQPAPPPAASPALQQLLDFGFPRERCEDALSRCNGNVEAAVNWLLGA
eukprot:TRINITY_DN71887_c0_g1_i1.p1 TRINITY_DN71887_c0_g1~~TRINITY_DN71887_c0_g1_i1.p1  ORF type:complete len:521 (+),score=81.75 TRINITY_DN71887_c0_g1_i1:39-1601(+)